MPSFSYTARTASSSIQRGTIVAANRASAIKSLTDKHLSPILVKDTQVKRNLKSLKIPFLKPKVKAKDLVIMTRQLATMVNAGVPILQSLQTLQEQTESVTLKGILSKVNSNVEDGGTLSDALAEHPDAFSLVYVNMVKAGEAGGILDKILDRLAFQVEKDSDIKSKVKGAMIYPSVIIVVTFAAFIFLMTGIVPKLKSIFDEFGGELPVYTKALLAVSQALLDYGWLLAIIAICAGFGLYKYAKTKKGKHLWHKLLLKMPIFGLIIVKVNIARFARTFSSLAGAGVSVLDGLKITAHALNNVIISDGIEAGVIKVREGQPVSAALDQAGIFPPIVSRMTAVGEETGQVDKVLEKVAEFYEKEVDRVVANLTSILEPLIIIMMGGVVGLIIASVFGPLSNLSNVVG